MPIDYKKYPPNWNEIRKRILKRAKNKCEGIERYPDCRAENYKMHPITGSYVVLTVAHLDHDPENWEVKDERLKVLCQRCHLEYDRQVKKYGKEKDQLRFIED